MAVKRLFLPPTDKAKPVHFLSVKAVGWMAISPELCRSCWIIALNFLPSNSHLHRARCLMSTHAIRRNRDDNRREAGVQEFATSGPPLLRFYGRCWREVKAQKWSYTSVCPQRRPIRRNGSIAVTAGMARHSSNFVQRTLAEELKVKLKFSITLPNVRRAVRSATFANFTIVASVVFIRRVSSVGSSLYIGEICPHLESYRVTMERQLLLLCCWKRAYQYARSMSR